MLFCTDAVSKPQHDLHFQIKLCFPEEGLVYDYRLEDAGISNLSDEEEEDKGRKVIHF